ncbi:MAG: 50S ribosomal protein L29 [Synergistaceae bacterium]|nr:50S ribosomal protein L29 [Synergistaceae bacterium]
MKSQEFRDLSIAELKDKHKQLKEELFNLRFQNAIGQLNNVSRIKEVKKNTARVLTVLTEKENGEAKED